MSNYPVDKAYLIGFAVEGILYGLYLCLFFCSMAFLTWRRRTSEVNWPMLCMSIVLFCASTIHFGFNFDNIITAFITKRDSTPGGPPALIDSPAFDLRMDVMFSTNNFLGDAVLVYRCWHVWERSWKIVVLPIMMLLTYTISAIVGLYHLGRIVDGVGDQFSTNVLAFGTASFTLSLCLNFIVTGLIAGRIYYLAKKTSSILPRNRSRQYMDIIGIVVESGAIFCAGQVIFVTLWSIHSNAHWIGAHPASQIYCIVPTLIIVRVGLGVSSTETSTYTATANKSQPSGNKESNVLRFAHSGTASGVTWGHSTLEMNSVTGKDPEAL